MSDPVHETFVAAAGFVALAALVLVLILVSVYVIPVVVVVGGAYVAYRNYYNSDANQERRSKEHTLALYQAAKSTRDVPDRITFGKAVYRSLPDDLPEPVVDALLTVALDLYDMELFANAIPEPPPICNSIEGARYRDMLSKLSGKGQDAYDRMLATVERSYGHLADAVPSVSAGPFRVPLHSVLQRPNQTIQDFVLPYFRHDDLFDTLKAQLERNQHEVSGVPLTYTTRHSPKLINPADYDDDALVFLKHTPFEDIFTTGVPFGLPGHLRFEHLHLVAGSGHGKTQTMQYMIAKDLEAVSSGEASIIVMDSQRQMIDTIKHLKCFAPGQPLHGKLIVIDPTDTTFPIALSLFSSKRNADPTEAERLRNSAISLISFALGGLLAAQMTSFQQTLFGFVIRACMAIPNANITTFVEVLEDVTPFARHLDDLSPLAKKFFQTQYNEPEFKRTRGEVARRAWGILENDTFTRMFSAPHSRLDFFDEMNAGKVILIDTAKNHMHEASTLFGRFFIAMVLQASQERVNTKKLPTYFYIDEAHEYFDSNVTTMLEQARKSKVGMVLAHQYLGQLGAIRESVMANTSIKFAGGVSHDDGTALAKAMNTTSEFIRSQPKLTFAAHLKGQGTVALSIPAGHMEDMERMEDSEWVQVRQEIRDRYAYEPKPYAFTQKPEMSEPVYSTPRRATSVSKPRKTRTTTTRVEAVRMEQKTTEDDDDTAPTDW